MNAIMIEQVQSLPDTTITLINGKKLVVKNAESEVVKQITAYYQEIGIQVSLMKAGDANE